MKKFLVIYHTPAGFKKQDSSPEDMAEGMKAWMTWAEKCGSHLLDMGSPLGNGTALSPDGKSSASKQDVAGFSVLQAENMEAAKKLLDGHPHLSWDASCSIEIHEYLPMPGM